MIFDLTQLIDDKVPIYPGDPLFKICAHSTIPSDGYSVQSISLGSHTGTHVDAPSHFCLTGKAIHEIPLSSFIGPAVVIDVTGKQPRERITWEDILPFSKGIRRDSVVLFRTEWSKHWGTPTYFNHPFLDRHIAVELLKKGVTRIGVDTLSPDETEGQSGDFGIHETILNADGLIIENLCNLRSIPSNAMISFAPLLLNGGDGSPVRAYAWDSAASI